MDGKEVKVVGIVAGARIITTKNGSKMAFVKIEDKIKQMEAIIFPKTYEAFSNLIVQDAIVMVKGKISTKDREGNGLEEVKIMDDEIKHINEDWLKSQPVKLDNKPHADVQSDEDSKSEPKNKDAKPEMSEESKEESKTAKITKYYLKLKASDEQVLREIHRLVLANPPKQTKSQVILVFGEKPDQTAILLPQRVEANDSLSKALSLVVGEVNIVIK